MPFKAKNNREAVVVCAKHVVKRPSKRSVLVCIILSYLVESSIPDIIYEPTDSNQEVVDILLLFVCLFFFVCLFVCCVAG